MGNFIQREAPDIRGVLTGLVGQTIWTIARRRPNRILGVSAGAVLAATGQSPDGKLVKIAELQDAADRLYRDGELEITVRNVGYRSAFVGAVLATLSGTVAESRPRRIRLVGS